MNATSNPALATELSLIIGGPDSGKSTFLVQLFGRLQNGSSALCLVGAPESLGPVRDGLARLSQGLPVRHTSAGTEVIQDLTTMRADGGILQVSIPDYPGEIVDELVGHRRIPPQWRDLTLESARWMLFVRIEQMPALPGLPAREETEPQIPEQPRELPMDIRLVELLQILRHERRRHMSSGSAMPDLTIVLSCWDEITDRSTGVAPTKILAKRMPLLHSYAETNWQQGAFRIVGLSAQGCPLDDGNPDPQFIDCGPESMGYLVREDGSETADLSELLAR